MVDRSQEAGADPAIDLPAVEARCEQLPARDAPVLPVRDARHDVESTPHITV